MAYVLNINGVDRSNLVLLSSLQKDDNLNERVDTLRFSIQQYGTQVFKPQVNEEVTLYDGATKIYGGVIVAVDENLDGDSILNCDVECKDYSQFLDRRLVLERYTNVMIDEIIAAIILKYAPTFTYANVDAPILVTAVTFNRIPISECLSKLAAIINYYWYVDENKDIHFFAKNSEVSPFDIADNDDNKIFESLTFSNDFSQIRNRVTIRGGEEEGNDRIEKFNGDGSELYFRLANKFARRPFVRVGGVDQTVGIDFLDEEADFDCFWDFNQRYVRFKTATVPPIGVENVEIEGTPLFPILIQRSDSASISQYGIYEYFEVNAAIKSRDEALEFALAKLTAYKNAIVEGSFDTYTPGLRSGQVINVNLSIFGMDEDFLIQKVSMRLEGPGLPRYRVQLATLRTLGIIQVLQMLLQRGGNEDLSNEILFSFNALYDEFTIGDNLISISSSTGPYEWEQPPGSAAANPFSWNLGTWS